MSAGSITWVEALEHRIRNVLASDDLEGLRILLANRHPADIAEVIDRLDDDDKIRLFRLLPPRQAADVLGETSAEQASSGSQARLSNDSSARATGASRWP